FLLVGGAHQSLSDEHCVCAIFIEFSHVLGCAYSTLGHKRDFPGNHLPEPDTVSDIHLKIREIPVVDYDNTGITFECPLHFFLTVCLHKSIKSQLSSQLSIGFQLSVIQDSTNQKDCAGSQLSRLIDHILIYGKVFPQHWNRDLSGNLFQISILPLEPERLCQTGDSRCPRLLILARNL